MHRTYAVLGMAQGGWPVRRFTVEEQICRSYPEESHYEIFDQQANDIVAIFYFKWFLKSHVMGICRDLERRIKTGKAASEIEKYQQESTNPCNAGDWKSKVKKVMDQGSQTL